MLKPIPASASMISVCIVCYPSSMLSPTFTALIIIITMTTLAVVIRKQRTRWIGLIQGIALQMAVVVPISVAQLTGFVWKSWSIDRLEAVGVFPLSILFNMGGWTVITPFEWLVPKRQTWVFSNIPEYSMLWFSKVMIVAAMIAWRREHCTRRLDLVTGLILVLVLIDSWTGRKFPWWGT